jgi:putative hydrolase of the HAD superfamily
MDEAERRNLVELLRSATPREPVVDPPAIPPELARLLETAPPRIPRAILLDVYGTLVASAAGAEPLPLAAGSAFQGSGASALLERELSDAGYELNLPAFSAEVAARIARVRARLLIRTRYPEVNIERILSSILPTISPERLRRISVLLESSCNPCSAMPGAKDFIASIAAWGVALGLVSNAQFYTPLLLNALFGAPLGGLGFHPGLCVFSYSLGKAKPAAEPFERAAWGLQRLGIPPREALVIGNSAENDIVPAKRLGFMTGLFAGDARSFRPEEGAQGQESPDIVIARFEGLSRRLGLA